MKDGSNDILYRKIGVALMSAQRVEYLTHGLVSHFGTIKTDKSFDGLTPRIFLDNSSESKKLRKQTLGQVFKILKLSPVLVLENELNDFLEKRNHLVHHFWRERLGVHNKDIKSAMDFCDKFIVLAFRVEKFYRGFLFELAVHAAKKEGKELPDNFKKMKKENKYFLARLQGK